MLHAPHSSLSACLQSPSNFYLQAGEFCSFHGLTVFEGCVHFSRSSFIEPETRFSVKRALKLIESKRNSSVGEASTGLF